MKFGKISISFGFALVLALLYFFDSENLIFLILSAFFLHELGHFAAVKLLRGQIKKIELSASGMCMKIAARPPFSYQKELFVTLSGPGISIICAILGSFAATRLNIYGIYVFAGINAVTAIFNMLPVRQLDGGRALFLLLSYFIGLEAAEKILAFTGYIVIFMLFVSGCGILLLTGYNFTLILTAAYLLIFIKKRKGLVKKHTLV